MNKHFWSFGAAVGLVGLLVALAFIGRSSQAAPEGCKNLIRVLETRVSS